MLGESIVFFFEGQKVIMHLRARWWMSDGLMCYEGLVALIISWADHAGEDQVEDELMILIICVFARVDMDA